MSRRVVHVSGLGVLRDFPCRCAGANTEARVRRPAFQRSRVGAGNMKPRRALANVETTNRVGLYWRLHSTSQSKWYLDAASITAPETVPPLCR